MTDPLDWIHKSVDIPADGLRVEREATDAERQAVADALGLLALQRLVARYRIGAIEDGSYRLAGSLVGEADQACVVTLDPVRAVMEVPFEVEFKPSILVSESDEDASVLDGPDIETLEGGIIPAGHIVFETFAASLDPYPRREGAEFTWQNPRLDEPEKLSPFAVLSKLKDQA